MGWTGAMPYSTSSGEPHRSDCWLPSSLSKRKEEKDERHQEREERRRELEFVPKARFEDWDQERTDDL